MTIKLIINIRKKLKLHAIQNKVLENDRVHGMINMNTITLITHKKYTSSNDQSDFLI